MGVALRLRLLFLMSLFFMTSLLFMTRTSLSRFITRDCLLCGFLATVAPRPFDRSPVSGSTPESGSCTDERGGCPLKKHELPSLWIEINLNQIAKFNLICGHQIR